jgi:hypothetical protein
MTSKENRADVSHYAVAIARWDDDGGAFMSAPGNMGARPSNGGDSRRIAESPAVLKSDRSSGDDRKILECLGASVIMQWGTLPTKSNGISSNARFPSSASGIQRRQRGRSRDFCITIRMTAIGRRVG